MQHILFFICLLCCSAGTAGFCNVPYRYLKPSWSFGSITGGEGKKMPSIGGKMSFVNKAQFSMSARMNSNGDNPAGRFDASTPDLMSPALLSSEPTVLTLKDGVIIPCPRGISEEIKAYEVCEYGEGALQQLLPETSLLNKLQNEAKLRYSGMRHQLLQNFRGKWVAVNSKGTYIIAETEAQVRQIAEFAFPFPIDDYHADCVGCEIIRGVVMDGTPAIIDCTSDPEEDGAVFVMPPDLSSAVSPKREFIIRAEHSFTGQEFKSYLMKHNSGASMMGVPGDVLSNPPGGVKLERGDNRYYVGPSGRRDIARVYKNNFIRVAGQTFKVNVIESRTWLLGYPVLSRFRNVLDVTAKEVVSLEPLN